MPRIKHKSPSSERGSAWEKTVFGCDATQFRFQKHIPTISEALNTVAKSQSQYNWLPEHPSTVIALNLFKAVQSHLKPEDAIDLKFYCSIGSALDWHYGADGFFRVRTHVVLIDLTTNQNKRSRRAVIFQRENRQPGKIWIVGKRIANILNTSIKKTLL